MRVMAGWKGSTQFSPRRHQSRRKDRREEALGKPNTSGPGHSGRERPQESRAQAEGKSSGGQAGRGCGVGAPRWDPASKQNRALRTSKSNCPGDLQVINLQPQVRSNFGHKLLIPWFSGRTGRRKGTQPKSKLVPFGRALGKSSA